MKKNETKSILNVPEKNKEETILDKWDEKLNDYDNYVKDYLIHYKKSLKGNTISLSRYPYLKVKTENLSKKLNKGIKKELLTKKQLTKVYKIRKKIVNACCN
ncbi:hypothetical protein QLS91_16860 [Flavobacterium sp. LB2P84]|jgi:hypothetical protein|uniref:Uncharacterized protein n=1 Tax=Flavobacterium yafengii TaxID=3041253 RepID=A0AAW6TUV4_9FLAO|nr:hypothetical protein [Flavobacterium yafengii]MDI5899525.1 hypothetical protein [Flavobacterium yafengii]MDI5951112.1 hypothetical protein [Flavobacterium yafengii]MDI6034749.1 hypothetical protein [Flavobacterium yafengii]MDI6046345.1 hypothetical protein [Flavobacterium yafengii]